MCVYKYYFYGPKDHPYDYFAHECIPEFLISFEAWGEIGSKMGSVCAIENAS